MLDLTFEQLNNAHFTLYGKNPVVRCFGLSTVVADPSVITPESSHDNKWHMFCHTLIGVYLFDSSDGINWTKQRKVLDRAMRPDVKYIDGTYYLYYERVQALPAKALTLIGAKWRSGIYLVTSRDLVNWSEPQPVLGDEIGYAHCKLGVSVSNPFLLDLGDKYRLYFSAGLTFIKDCGFSEPTYISFAEGGTPDGKFTAEKTPIFSPDCDSAYLNLCCGCIKVYRLKDCFIGLQNGIFLSKDGKSHSAIMLLKSADGKVFTFVKPLVEPAVCDALGEDKDWMKQYVYASSLAFSDGKLSLYFNARDTSNPILGREHIGLISADVKDD